MSSTLRSTCWSITINNPCASDDELINLARQRGWKVEGQLEKGQEGTFHYQLRLITPQVRWSAVKKAFPRAHIEVARDPVALGKYVTKEETRAGSLPTGQDKYPSLSKVWDLIYQVYNSEDTDGWNVLSLSDGAVEFYDEDLEREFRKTPLVVFDRAIKVLILKGYHLESIASNPSTRSMWKLYARELIARSASEAEQQVVQTDRQTDSVQDEQEVVVPMDITNGSEDDEEESVRSSPSPRASP